ncbi:hypothetical protein BD769DRAFT_1386457 [Suillus cothurnatus]|nr:hypothetical protein BD769DRAFT_1386457 [Suillus cothurnatus]
MDVDHRLVSLRHSYDTDGTEQLPIILHQISEEDFTHFLNWVYHISSVPPPPEEQFLVAIFKMGFKVYTIIARAKEVMERERRALAAYPPSLLVSPSFSCSSHLHSQCKEAWSGFWWKKVARAILHPMNPLPLTQILQLVIEAPLPNGMNIACKQAMVDAMIELEGLEVEERIIEGVIRAVTLYFNSL